MNIHQYFTCNTKLKTGREASQDNKSAREELEARKTGINWTNCFLQRWMCYRYYGYSEKKNLFPRSTMASLNQSLHLRLMRNNILDLRRISALQVRKLWQNSSFTGPNMKAWINPFQPSVTFHIEQMTGFQMKCNNKLK